MRARNRWCFRRIQPWRRGSQPWRNHELSYGFHHHLNGGDCWLSIAFLPSTMAQSVAPVSSKVSYTLGEVTKCIWMATFGKVSVSELLYVTGACDHDCAAALVPIALALNLPRLGNGLHLLMKIHELGKWSGNIVNREDVDRNEGKK